MSQLPFSTDWLKKFSDPYATLGLSVTADDRRVLKRYYKIAKLLHPDVYASANPSQKELAGQILTRMINPAYQKLKQETDRAEMLATLRFRVKRLNRDTPFSPTSRFSRELLQAPFRSIDVYYEQKVDELSQIQYQDLQNFEQMILTLGELNRVYLLLKMGEPIREQSIGLVPSPPGKPIIPPPVKPLPEEPVNYAQRHYQRAQEYTKKENWQMAIQELKDALSIEANNSDYHALIAKAYFMQNLPGMAKVHFRQALKFNSHNKMALAYAKRLKIEVNNSQNGKGSGHQSGSGLFGLFARKR